MSGGFPGFKNDVVMTDAVHHRIHQGLFFSATNFAEAIVDDGTLTTLLRTSAAQSAHLRVFAAAGGSILIRLYEGATVSSLGTPIVPANRNRFSTYAATTQISYDATISNDGTLLDQRLVPGGSGGNSSGGSGGFFNEWILKLNTDYVLRLVNVAGNAQPGALQVDFYEPIGGV